MTTASKARHWLPWLILGMMSSGCLSSDADVRQGTPEPTYPCDPDGEGAPACPDVSTPADSHQIPEDWVCADNIQNRIMFHRDRLQEEYGLSWSQDYVLPRSNIQTFVESTLYLESGRVEHHFWRMEDNRELVLPEARGLREAHFDFWFFSSDPDKRYSEFEVMVADEEGRFSVHIKTDDGYVSGDIKGTMTIRTPDWSLSLAKRGAMFHGTDRALLWDACSEGPLPIAALAS